MSLTGVFLARIVVGVLAILLAVYDAITVLVYVVVQRPWLRYSEMHQVRSVRTHTSYRNSSITYDSIRKMPEHFLLDTPTIDAALDEAHRRFASRECVGFRDVISSTPGVHEGKPIQKVQLTDYKWMTMGAFYQQITLVRQYLNAIGVHQGDMVMIFADTSHKWLVSALSIITNGSILVTMYTSLSDSAIVHGIQQVKVRHIITTHALYKRLKQYEENLPLLENVILLDSKDSDVIEQESGSKNIVAFDWIVEKNSGFENLSSEEEQLPKIRPDDVAIIMYTSGTGGVPKGVRITHRNFLAGMRANLSQIGFFLNEIERHTIIAYLPLAHILEIITECFLLFVGARVGFSSPATITDISAGLQAGVHGDATLLRPTLMTAVPLVLERIRKGILQKLQNKGLFAVRALEYLVAYKSFWTSKGFRTPILDRLVFGQFAKVVGGRLEILMVGGAAIPSKTQEFTRNVLNVILSQGYGSTETVGNGLFTDENDMSLGKVGGPLCGLRVRLVSWVEGGYCIQDTPNPRGEIHFCSDSVADGYYQLDKLSESSFYVEDGRRWFRTGDIAEVFPNGSFKIIDRKKDFIKFAFGEYVSLGKIESKLKSSYIVNNVCIVAQAQLNRVVALLVPNFKVIKKLARLLKVQRNSHENTIGGGSGGGGGGSGSSAPHACSHEYSLCENELIRRTVLKKLRHFGRDSGLRNCELPTDVVLLADDWTPENGLVTASFKIKRKALEHNYSQQLSQLLAHASQ